jgi:hypothetical protein
MLYLGCCFITFREPCNNQWPICDIAWLHVTNYLYHSFPWYKYILLRLWSKIIKHVNFATDHVKLSSRPLKSVNIWNRSPFWNAVSREFRCRWRHLAFKLRLEIDIRNTFTLIKTVLMRFKQIIKDIYRLWCQNGAILLLPSWLNNQSQTFPEKHSP